jgi:hypothetical protein
MEIAMRRSRLAGAVLGALALGLALPANTSVESSLPSVKAAFVFNFIKLVSWPERRFDAERSPVKVCVLRGDDMLDILRQSISGKLSGTHPIEVTVVGGEDNLSACHVLYLGTQASGRYAALMSRVSGKGVLLVDEGDQFTWPDGMIRLFLEQNRVRFELNLESLERAGLKVDPRLIRLARIATH